MKKEYRTEFHVHTRYSKDSCLNYLMLLLMLKIKKIDTIVITDHNEIKGALKYQKKLNISKKIKENCKTNALQYHNF